MVLVGQDLRPSSPMLADQINRIARLCGFRPTDIGPVPTPALAYAAGRAGACAIMVTGSHIPADRNGLKFYDFEGEISKRAEAAITARAHTMDGLELIRAAGANKRSLRGESSAGTRKQVLDDWHNRYASLFSKGAFSLLRIGVLVGSSVAAEPLLRLLCHLGAETFTFGRSVEFAPLDTEAVEASIVSEAMRQIGRKRLHCVVSTDPDGDRPLVLDAKGTVMRGDLLGWSAARWLGADHVITTVNANSAITDDGRLMVERTRIGSPYVIEALSRSRRLLPAGFEPNGGFLLGGRARLGGGQLEPLVTRDSFLPILAALKLAADGERLSDLADSLNFHAALSDRIPDIDRMRAGQLLSSLVDNETARRRFFDRHGRIVQFDMTDGIRVGLATSSPGNSAVKIVHLRLSGNAPELRIYVEARTTGAASELLAAVRAQLEPWL